MVNYGFKYYRSFGYYILGAEIRGTISNPYRPKFWYETHQTWTLHISPYGSWTYRVRNGKQQKYVYKNPGNKGTSAQLNQQNKLRQAVLKWHSLTETEKKEWRDKRTGHKVMSGFNFFVSEYIKSI